MLTKQEILDLTAKVIDIGENDSFFITSDVSTNKNGFSMEIFIHQKGFFGNSHGIIDSRYVSNYIFTLDWLNGWAKVIQKGESA